VSDADRMSYDWIVATTGKKQHAAQLRVLRDLGIRAYRLDKGKGPVCVLRCWLDARTKVSESKPKLKSDRVLEMEGR
jgi:hypothetical protein